MFIFSENNRHTFHTAYYMRIVLEESRALTAVTKAAISCLDESVRLYTLNRTSGRVLRPLFVSEHRFTSNYESGYQLIFYVSLFVSFIYVGYAIQM